MPFPKTHNLIELLALCLPLDGMFELQRDRLDTLTDYAVQFRYPGESADREEARRAYKTVTEVRAFMRAKLCLNE